MLRALWADLFEDKPWPGADAALAALVEEVRMLRLLTDTMVASAVDDDREHRSWDEIQRAHDLVGQYCVEAEDEDTFRYVAPLCWILRHDHNTGFAQILKRVEDRLEHLGLRVVRLPELHYPEEE